MDDSREPSTPAEPWLWRLLMKPRWEAFFRLPMMTRDALGRECKVSLERVARHAKTLTPPHDAAVFWSTIPRWFVVLVVALGLISMAGATGLVLGSALRIGPRWFMWPVTIASGCIFPFIATGVVSPFIRRMHARSRCVPACCAARVCANCCYPLGGLPAAEGVTACPECGFAWRLS